MRWNRIFSWKASLSLKGMWGYDQMKIGVCIATVVPKKKRPGPMHSMYRDGGVADSRKSPCTCYTKPP